MKALKTGLGLLPATIAIFAVPMVAHAEYLVPPGNSAATQYTEAVPTAGGPKITGHRKHSQSRSPGKVLGTRNTERLDAQGPQGREVAEVVAATAPTAIGAAAQEQAEGNSAQGGASHGGSPTGGAGEGGSAGKTNPTAQQASTPAQASDGSSGLGEAIGQATGSSSSGQLGLLLPLFILAVLAWSVAFVSRHRKTAD
jgi:hypothetical protein